MTKRVLLLSETDEGQALLEHTREMLQQFGVQFASQKVADRNALATTLADAAIIIVANSTLPPLSDAVAALTEKVVLAVPNGLESLQATAGLAANGAGVGTLAIGKAGAINAALFAVAILANGNADLQTKLEKFRAEQTRRVLGDALD